MWVRQNFTGPHVWTSPVCLVHLVCFVYLVGLVQPNKRDKPDKPNNGLLMLEDFFSILRNEVLCEANAPTACDVP